MPGTATGLRPDATARLAALERDRPEWRSWLALLGEIRRELDSHEWVSLVATPDSRLSTPDSPLLHDQTLEFDAGRARRLVRRLAQAAAARADGTGAASLTHYRPDRKGVLQLLEAAIREDEAELAVLATLAGVHPGSLAAIARLAVIPVLHACGRLLHSRVPPAWPQGYCPVCGAWPTLAERRGLDRSRWLRCGRCSAAWEVEPLWCSYCGERDHRKLGSLVLEGAGDRLKVDTCESCRGALKSAAVLLAIPPFELLLQDLETVELDLAAQERGYSRPERVRSPKSGVWSRLELNIVGLE